MLVKEAFLFLGWVMCVKCVYILTSLHFNLATRNLLRCVEGYTHLLEPENTHAAVLDEQIL